MNGDSSAEQVWFVRASFGPLASHAGFKNWLLCLSETGIVAIPLGFGPTVRAGLGLPVSTGLGGTVGHVGGDWLVRRAYVRPYTTPGQFILTDRGQASWRRYPALLLDKVLVKCCPMSANEVHLQLIGQKKHLYGLMDRDQTDPCRVALGQLFPGVYSEQRFHTKPRV